MKWEVVHSQTNFCFLSALLGLQTHFHFCHKSGASDSNGPTINVLSHAPAQIISVTLPTIIHMSSSLVNAVKGVAEKPCVAFPKMERKKKGSASNNTCDVSYSPLDPSKESNFSLEYPHGHKIISSKIGMMDGNGSPAGASGKPNQVGTVMLFGVPIVSLIMDAKERLCLAQISSTLLKEFSYNEIHNRRVALGITCIQCTPVQLEILRRAGAMPVTSRRCGMITRREAERLCQSFLGDHAPPQLPENFAFEVYHECAWGCRGAFVPSRYNSSRAKCIRCSFCQLFFSPNKFIFHSHRLPDSRYVQPDAANFNSWRRHLRLCGDPPEDDMSSAGSLSPSAPFIPIQDPLSGSTKEGPLRHLPKAADTSMATAQIVHAWEDVKAMFNGGTRKRLLAAHTLVPVSSASSQMKRSAQSLKGSSSTQQGVHGNGHGNSSRAATPQPSRQHNYQAQTEHMQLCENMSATVPGFLSPMSGLRVPSPLLSPGAIWNPGIPGIGGRSSFPVASGLPQLPLSIHPLSIPWLRRPLFPFSHPFGPTCKFLGESTMPSESSGPTTVPNTGGRPPVSAFKPVGQRSPTDEHLLNTWLTSAGLQPHTSLPEDLSLNSGTSSNHSSYSPGQSPSQSLDPSRNNNNYDGMSKKLDGSNSKTTNMNIGIKAPNHVVSSSRSSSLSPDQVPGARPMDGESSSDDETVDIESTDNEFWKGESDGISKVWELEGRKEGKRPLDVTGEDEDDVKEVDSQVRHVGSSPIYPNNNQRNRSPAPPANGSSKRKKRLWDFDARCSHID